MPSTYGMQIYNCDKFEARYPSDASQIYMNARHLSGNCMLVATPSRLSITSVIAKIYTHFISLAKS